MPITTQESGGQAIALEGQAIEREIERKRQQQQLFAASNDKVTEVPAKFREAVKVARQRLDQAEASFVLADTNARLRIRREQPSEQLARLWYEQDILSAERERELAKAALAEAELALGRQVEARRALERLEASAPARRADAERRYQAELNAIDRELLTARAKCAIE